MGTKVKVKFKAKISSKLTADEIHAVVEKAWDAFKASAEASGIMITWQRIGTSSLFFSMSNIVVEGDAAD